MDSLFRVLWLRDVQRNQLTASQKASDHVNCQQVTKNCLGLQAQKFNLMVFIICFNGTRKQITGAHLYARIRLLNVE